MGPTYSTLIWMQLTCYCVRRPMSYPLELFSGRQHGKIPVQAAYLSSQGLRKMANTWRQLTLFVNYRRWHSRCGNTATPGNMMNLIQKTINSTSSLSIRLSRPSVTAWHKFFIKEHHHVFTMPLADHQQLTLTEKVEWLEFLTLAQQRGCSGTSLMTARN
jgi:hypothetical protein